MKLFKLSSRRAAKLLEEGLALEEEGATEQAMVKYRLAIDRRAGTWRSPPGRSR